MNTKILTALIAAALITGCSATNKATRSPNGENATATDAGYDKYENYQNSTEDQYLRMKVQNPSLWGSIDDYSYWNNSQYDFGYSCNSSQAMLLSSFYNPYGFGYNPFGYYGGFGFGYGWNSWYSPYQTIVLYKSPAVYFNPKNTTSAIPVTAYRSIPAASASGVFKATSGGPSGSTASGVTRNTNNTTRSANSTTRSYNPAPVRSSSTNFGSTRSASFGGGGGFRAGGGHH